MLVSCPNCATQFAVPDKALGQKGRSLRCARCGEKWFQPPLDAAPELEQAPAPPPPPPTGEETLLDAGGTGGMLPGFDDFHLGDDDGGGAAEPAQDLSAQTVVAEKAERYGRGEPLPDAIGEKAPRRSAEPSRGGKAVVALWLIVVLLVLAGAAGYGVFAFQDRVVALWPPAAKYLEMAGLRREIVGAGLTFRNSSSERVVQNDKEMLVVRGIIANVTEQPRDVPLMRLALYDNQALVQDKVVRPPVDGLDPGATASFRIVLEQPHPLANRFEVTFTEPAPVAGQ